MNSSESQTQMEQDLRDMNAALLASSVRQHELAEQAQHAEVALRQIADSMPQIVWAARPDGYIDYYNERWYEFSGFPRGEFGQSSWEPILHPDDRQRCLDTYFGCILDGKPLQIEYRFKDRQRGGYRWFMGRALPIRDATGAIVRWFGTCTDIDDQKRVQQKLRDSESRLASELAATQALEKISTELIQEGDQHFLYERILDAAVAIMHADFASIQMLYPTDGARESGGRLRLLGYRGFSAEAAHAWEWVGADHATTCGMALRTGARSIAANVETCDFMAGTDELLAYRQTGIRAVQSTPLYSRSGRQVGMLSTHWQRPLPPEPGTPSAADFRRFDILARQAADLIERLRVEEALRESELRFRMLADNMSQLAWTCDRLGNVTWYNQRWLDYTGMTFEDMKGWDWSKVQHPDHLERVVQRVQRSAETGKVWEDTFPLRGKDGQYRWFLSRAVPIRNEAGEIVCWFGTNTDVTEQRQSANELRRLSSDLSDLNRRKDEFLAMLSHELRNPLAPIANAVHLLRLQRGNENQVQQQARGIIERQVGQLAHLVDDLLEISRITTGRVQLRQEQVAVAGIVERAVETAGPLIKQRRHELTVSVPAQPVWLHADADRLEQVVVNLLTNAAKYTDDGGHVWLTVQEEGDRAVLRVRDTGVGIAPELLPHIFDLFTQADRSLDRSQGGLGIGLCLVQRLVELHGGTVTVSSVPGEGSEFVVRLPLTSVPPLPSPSTETAKPSVSLRILVVDDNVDAAESLAMVLRLSRHLVRTAHDGPTALDALLDYKPDVVLLDIGLPGLNGLEVAKRIRQEPTLQKTVLVAMTGYGQESDRQRSQEAGFDAHLVKPADARDLQRILTDVAEGMKG